MGFKGPAFTWKRGAIWERLDRMLGNDAWFNQFLLTFVTHLSLAGSDHRPMLINITSTDNHTSSPPFRYLNMWTAHPSYNKYIADLWKGEAENEVKKLEHEEQISNVKEKELLIAQNNLLCAIKYQEKFLKHKAWLHDNADIANDAISYYKDLLNQEHHFRPPIEKTHFLAELNYTTSLKLSDILNEKEIWNAISSIDNNKSAGPDGFTAGFYKNSWEIIKADVIAAVTSFFQGNNLPKYFCASTTVLILKSDIQ
ncbi:uncharacterized protein LOC110037721 [Phalaenopsis equestris]|uniref:uncharacterized protein LOC110037721 n=1 Tax=Phalaenopsis equestris TaxID=78828 RepID=UPI0009E22DAD|nr:uncharacterized protein LOC110037721 [Phalaenopsis equestris]